MATQLLLKPVDTTPAQVTTGAITDAEAAALWRAVVMLFGKWQVSDSDAATLLDLTTRTYRRWKAAGAGMMGRDTRARLSNLVGIHMALRQIFREAERGYRWVRTPNAAFDGASAMDVMLGGDLTDLMRVRRYLDATRGGW